MLTTLYLFVFFFNDTATTEIYTLSLHDALPIFIWIGVDMAKLMLRNRLKNILDEADKKKLFITTVILVSILYKFILDRKSTRLNSSHANISYAVFCLKKKKKIKLIYCTNTTMKI